MLAATRRAAWLGCSWSKARPQTCGSKPAAVCLKPRAPVDKRIRVDMGSPHLRWEQIPLAREMETSRLDFTPDGLSPPGAVNMGNPHVVFFVDDAQRAPAETLGPKIEVDPLFPQRVNVGFAEVRGPGLIRLRVWERGAGLTKACGTGACAALVAAHRQGRAERKRGNHHGRRIARDRMARRCQSRLHDRPGGIGRYWGFADPSLTNRPQPRHTAARARV